MLENKQIIINGVDVSGCEFLGFQLTKKYMCTCGNIDFCNEEPNCYYKQLKRKEQECEESKDKLNCCFCNPHVELNDIEKQRKCVEVTECFRRQLDRLKAEVKSKDCQKTYCPRHLKGFNGLYISLAEFDCEEVLNESKIDTTGNEATGGEQI